VSSPGRTWERALPGELAFWEQYIATGGLEFPREFQSLLDPATPIADPFLLGALERVSCDPIRILDVGAGPFTTVGHHDPGNGARAVEVVAVDPLGDQFAALIERAGLSPPVPTTPCRGEDLVSRFGSDRFDIAYARNSVDHAADPLLVIENMLSVVRPGGEVILHHYRREAENMGYEGLHQWNFDLRDGRVVLFNRHRAIDVGAELSDRARTDAVTHEGGYHAAWIAATITRRV
jgi:SAM-dependent methyltransferase